MSEDLVRYLRNAGGALLEPTYDGGQEQVTEKKSAESNAPLWLVILGIGLLLMASSSSVPGTVTAPISDPGFRALITYPEAMRDQLPIGQKQMLTSTDLRAWLDANCVKNAAGKEEWRIWPDDADPKNEGDVWKRLMPLAKGKGMWVVAGNGKQGVNQKAPEDAAAMIKLLEPLAAK